MAQYRHLINNILSFPLPELLLPLNNTIMSLLDCPPEIIDHIISFVPVWDTPPTYGTLSLICRSLRDAGQKHIFRKVSLQMNAPPNTKNRFLGCTGNTKNAETEHPLPPSFLRLHQVLKANPTLSGHVSTLWIHTHMRNPANPFWMSDTDSEDAAIAIWVDILALISGRSLSITAFEMTTTQTPSSWNRINQDIRSKIVEIWCKPTMKRIYMNSIEDLPRNLFGLRGMCAEKVYLWHFSLGSDFGEKRDDRNPNGEDQIVPGNKGPGIISLLVGFDSDEWLSTFISAILLHPSNAASLRGTSSLNLVVQLNADLPETISVSLLPSFPSLKDLTLQWTSSLSASGTGESVPRNMPANDTLSPPLCSLGVHRSILSTQLGSSPKSPNDPHCFSQSIVWGAGTSKLPQWNV